MDQLLNVVAETTADAHILSVDGEVDLSTAATLEQAVTAAIDQAEPALVIVDLARVRFLSSSGISTLLKARQHGDDGGVALRLVVPPDAVMRRALEVTGMLDVLPIYPDLDSALAG